MNLRSIAERVLALPLVRYVLAVLDTYGKAPGGILANGLAFAALFSALPTTVCLLRSESQTCLTQAPIAYKIRHRTTDFSAQ